MGMSNDGTFNQKKWALITGASSGIGEAFAYRMASEGYNLVLVARRADRLTRIAGLLAQSQSVQTMTFATDLSDPKSIEELVCSLETQGITIDVLFNNAGSGMNGEFCDLDIAGQARMIDLNCKSLVTLSHHFGRQMRARGAGSIIHTASVGGLSPTPFYTTYGATKAFVVSFSEALGEELRPYGVRVITLCPGATETEFEKSSNFRGIRPSRHVLESAMDVADTAVRALKGSKSLVISGRGNQFAACLLRLIPRQISLGMAARSLRPMPVV
jgi:short-subunit dehydrogenase